MRPSTIEIATPRPLIENPTGPEYLFRVDTRLRIEAVRKRLRDMQIEERESEGAPSCRSCIFGPINDTGQGKCDHIAHWNRRWDAVAGKWAARNEVTTADARAPDGLCGPEALLFQPYSVPRLVAKWLSRANLVAIFLGLVVAIGIGVSIYTGS